MKFQMKFPISNKTTLTIPTTTEAKATMGNKISEHRVGCQHGE